MLKQSKNTGLLEKKGMLILFLLLVPISLLSYQWDVYGPENVEIFDFLFTDNVSAAGVAEGIMIEEFPNWQLYSYGDLPVWKMEELNDQEILLIMGNGSWSDGVYTFNIDSYDFTVQEWLYLPSFLEFNPENNTYYVGYKYGLVKSTDGYNWTEISYFNGMNCIAMACYENNLVISADGDIYYSSDSGTSWQQSSILPLSDFAFTETGELYGIFPDHSNSSGLWKSEDFGQTWDVEFWSDSMIAVAIDCNGVIFVGWEEPFEQFEGVGIWNPSSQELTLINEGLACLLINDIEIFPLVDAPSMICSTEDGGYFVTDYAQEQVTQVIPLETGWNNVFFNVQPEDSSIVSVLGQLGNNAYQILSQTQSATYYPPGIWIGNLTHISPGIEYRIDMLADDTLIVYGDAYICTDEMYLTEEWNWISFNVHPDDTSIESVFGVLGDDVYQVKNQTQSVSYENGIWIGNLLEIADGEGYLVYMNNSSDFSLIGIAIDYCTNPIYLTENWNWIAYTAQEPESLSVALSSIQENVMQIKNQTQSAIYWNGVWYGNLTLMEPCVGYKIQMSAEDTLFYTVLGGWNGETKQDEVMNRESVPENWVLMSGTRSNMVVIAETPYGLRTTTYALHIGVFDDEGNCRSIGVKQNLEGNDFWYFTIVGNEEVAEKKELYFKIYDKDAGKTYRSEETILFANNTTLGSPDKPIKITFAPEFTDEQVVPTVFGLYQNYPNPFNPKTKIEYQLPKDTQVEISIYNIRGEKVRTLVNEKKKAGYHNVIWNGIDDRNRELSSGVYLYRIKTDGYSAIKKMLLLR